MTFSKLLEFIKRVGEVFTGKRPQPEPESHTPLNRPRVEPVVLPISWPAFTVDVSAPRKQLREECLALGLKTGRESKRRDPQPQTLKLLEDCATDLAKTVHSRISALREQAMQAVFRRTQDAIDRLIEAKDVAVADLRDRRRELADLGPRSPCPSVSVRLVRCATVAFAFSLLPSIHDLVPLDTWLRWPVALFFSVGVAQLLVEGILPHGPSSPGRNWLRHGAFLAGLALAGAFLIIRREAAASELEYRLAYGLSLAEASITVMLEAVGLGLQPRLDRWHQDEDRRRRTEGLVGNAEEEQQARDASIREAERASEQALDALEKANVLSDLGALTSLGVNAVRQGYSQAISENDVSVRGLARKEVVHGVR